ncbi:glycosyltransferase family 2 protein [Aerococcus urinaeequi]|uniref:Glycosyltransferase family 2 protein n=1 Tax=Aerococcus urinaeequi TaxID=51665 RepID=A0AA47GAA2_9LACT|nr:glycosyltransferase family 2 protein [Aerococcus urinaeequi]WAT23983.1 glycosyltransferase family 2 protein [Aerococcus urinaeequi]
MKLSVIIPAYNAEENITQCIDSVLVQKFKDIEVVIVNDGSNDKTKVIVENIIKNDARIKLISQENSGPTIARRVGYLKSSGEYCIFLDSDDFWDENFLEETMPLLEESYYDLIMFKYKRITDKGVVTYRQPNFFEGVSEFDSDKDEIISEIASGYNLNNLVTKIIKREMLSEKNPYLGEENLDNGEDLVEVLNLIEKARKIYFLDRDFYNYRISENSRSTSFNKNFYKNLNTVRTKVRDFIIKNSVNVDKNLKSLQINYLIQLCNYLLKLVNNEANIGVIEFIGKDINKSLIYQESIIRFSDLRLKYQIILFLFNHKYYKKLKLISKLKGLRVSN